MTMTTIDPNLAADSTALARMMENILEGVVEVFKSAGVPLPERRYWTLSIPALDCEQVVVSFIQAYIGRPGDEAVTPQRCEGPRSAVSQVRVSRCVPTQNSRTNKAPGAAELAENASQLLTDAWVMLSTSSVLEQWGVSGPGLGVIATVEAEEASGGFQSTVMTLTMAVP